MKKPKSPSQLKKQLDSLFSEYIRRMHADEGGGSNCYTCGLWKLWKELQNGHFVSRAHLATRYSEDNCRPQCVGCNVFGGGRVSIFAEKLDEELGIGTVSRLYREANTTVKDFPYQEKIDHYKRRLEEMNNAF